MEKLYSGAVMAWRGTSYIMAAAYAIADKETTAIGEMLKMCKEAYPPDNGWQNHQVTVGVIPDDIIALVSKS